MAFSYSFHLSTKSHSVGTSGKVAQVSRHNLREYESADYDRTQIEILEGSDVSILDDVKRIYHEEFDEALEKYNKGRRADRQIGDYLKHVSDSRSDAACELIIQIGDKDFWESRTADERKQMSHIFKDQLRSLEKLVPELKVASAIIHYDEASPHMHVVGVPVADGYKKGLEKQVAKTKVFTADRLSYLQDRMRENAERGMNLPQNQNIFKGVELKAKTVGRNKDIPKGSLEEFYSVQLDVAALESKASEMQLNIAVLELESSSLRAEARRLEEEIQANGEKIRAQAAEMERNAEKIGALQAEIKGLSGMAAEKIRMLWSEVVHVLRDAKDAAMRHDIPGAERELSFAERHMDVQAKKIEAAAGIPAKAITEPPQRIINRIREQLKEAHPDDASSGCIQTAQKDSIRDKLDKYLAESQKGNTEPVRAPERHIQFRPKGR